MGVPGADLAAYYRERAGEYDEVYAKPERQTDIASLRSALPELVLGRLVFEVAGGTGYWTEVLSTTAGRILATDLNAETLKIARQRVYGCPVEFGIADAYDLGPYDGMFDVAFVGFWWSHVALGDLSRFLDSLHRRVGSGCDVIVLDNRYVEGSSHPITRTDDEGNTHQLRRLASGASYEVLKNFPSGRDLDATLEGRARSSLRLRAFEYFWLLTYTTV